MAFFSHCGSDDDRSTRGTEDKQKQQDLKRHVKRVPDLELPNKY